MDFTKHRVELFHRGKFNVSRIPLQLEAHRSTLNIATHIWADKQLPRPGYDPQNDLRPSRIGVINPSYADGVCTLLATPVSWAEFQVLRDPNLRAIIPIAERFWVLAVTCLVVSADGQYILGFRSSRQVSTSQNLWSVTAAGYVDSALVNLEGTSDLVPSVLTELEEEAGLGLPDLAAAPEALGLCIHPPAEHLWLEGTFMARSILDANKILARAKSAKDSWEGKHYAFSEDSVREMLSERPSLFHPPAAVNLALALELA